MAEGFARLRGSDRLDAFSAGSRPSGIVNPRAIDVMAELGYDLTTHASRGLDEVPGGPYDAIVTMGCGDSCPHLPAAARYDWEIPDPKHMPVEGFRDVRDEIGRRVEALIVELSRPVPSATTER